jgi:hypothetical protein
MEPKESRPALETEKGFLQEKDKFKMQTTFDRHGPILVSNDC